MGFWGRNVSVRVRLSGETPFSTNSTDFHSRGKVCDRTFSGSVSCLLGRKIVGGVGTVRVPGPETAFVETFIYSKGTLDFGVKQKGRFRETLKVVSDTLQSDHWSTTRQEAQTQVVSLDSTGSLQYRSDTRVFPEVSSTRGRGRRGDVSPWVIYPPQSLLRNLEGFPPDPPIPPHLPAPE